MDTTEIPQRWVTGYARPATAVGPNADLAQAWKDAGKPEPFSTFLRGYKYAAKELASVVPASAEVLAELQKAHRIIYLQRLQMSTPARTNYARSAHHAGLIGDDETRESERAAVLARAGVPL